MKSEAEAIEIEIDNNNKKAKRNRNRIQNQEREREGDGKRGMSPADGVFEISLSFQYQFSLFGRAGLLRLLQRVSGSGSGLDWVLVGAVVTQSAHDLRIRCAIWT